jgi:hypothetical protein
MFLQRGEAMVEGKVKVAELVLPPRLLPGQQQLHVRLALSGVMAHF